MRDGLRIALVHDYFVHVRGAERFLLVLADLFPTADVYMLVMEGRLLPSAWRSRRVWTSFLSRFPNPERWFRYVFPLYPYIVERLDFSDYDLVLSSSSGFAHGAITQPGTCHICFSHSPFRYAWNWSHRFLADQPAPVALIAHVLLSQIRMWDRLAADRVDHYVANSRTTAARIRKFYRREAEVINYPIDVSSFHIAQPEDYFLIVSGLMAYKRLEVAVQAFTRLGLPLKIVGQGPEEARLRAMSGPNVEFLGLLSERDLREAYARCRALIFPTDEDYGFTPIEAQASGRPVIAFRAGGALETVVEHTTGVFFDRQAPDALAEAVLGFRSDEYDPRQVRQHAMRFDVSTFRKRMLEYVTDKVDQHAAGAIAPGP